MALVMNRLSDLGDDVLRLIFEFDPTYRDMFRTKVADGVWGAAWRNWHAFSEECSSPFVAVAMEWLFQSWGVDKWGQPGYNPTHDPIPPLVFFKHHYFPSDIRVVNRPILEDIAHYVSIYVDDHRVLYCLVLTMEYYEESYAAITDDRESEIAQMIDVFVDRRAGLVVLI